MIYISYGQCRFRTGNYDSKNMHFLSSLFDSRVFESINKFEIEFSMKGTSLILHLVKTIRMPNDNNMNYFPNVSRIFAKDFNDILYLSILSSGASLNLEYYMECI